MSKKAYDAFMGGSIGQPVPKKPTKESLEESIRENENELSITKDLRDALKKYLLFEDYEDYSFEDTMPTFCLILGRLEMSIARRELALTGDMKELSNYE